MFTEVPGRYDLINRIITLGLDEGWRKKAVRECISDNPGEILDLCTGTGDLVLRMAKHTNGETNIRALDYSQPMLDIARKKAKKKGFEKIEFIQGDAADMPFGEGSLDAIGIGFAFRNLTYKNPDRDKFLKEISRVLRTGGKFVVVESSQPHHRIIRALFRFYLRVMVQGLGGLLSGHRQAYRYLAVSARNFYTPEEISGLLLEAGFSKVDHTRLNGGIAAITSAIK